jgi:hypothetical protein
LDGGNGVTNSISTGEAVATESQGAAIIPFPVRKMPAASLVQSPDQERLARALESLNTALADQKAALASWRGVLGELKATTSGLDESLRRYRSSLTSLGTSVSSLRDKAKTLEQWADNALAVKK